MASVPLNRSPWKKPLSFRRQTGKRSVAWFFTRPKQKWSTSCNQPPFWFLCLQNLIVFYLLQLKSLFFEERGNLEVWGIQELGHGLSKGLERLAWENSARTPRPLGRTGNPQLQNHSCCSRQVRDGAGEHTAPCQIPGGLSCQRMSLAWERWSPCPIRMDQRDQDLRLL